MAQVNEVCMLLTIFPASDTMLDHVAFLHLSSAIATFNISGNIDKLNACACSTSTIEIMLLFSVMDIYVDVEKTHKTNVTSTCFFMDLVQLAVNFLDVLDLCWP